MREIDKACKIDRDRNLEKTKFHAVIKTARAHKKAEKHLQRMYTPTYSKEDEAIRKHRV